jgi:hypothetical protein
VDGYLKGSDVRHRGADLAGEVKHDGHAGGAELGHPDAPALHPQLPATTKQGPHSAVSDTGCKPDCSII